MLICFLWKRECKQNCYTLWERSLATWHEMLWALFSLSHFYFIFSFFLNFTVIIAGTFKENKSKMGRVGGCSIKIVEEMHWREPGVVTRLCWLDVEKKIRTNGEQENDCWEKISNYISGSTNCLLPAVPKLTKRGQPWANSCPATPEASGGLVSVLQRTAISPVSWWSEYPERKAVQPETVCTLILSLLLCVLVSWIPFFFFFLYYEKLLSLWLLLAVTGDRRKLFFFLFFKTKKTKQTCAWTIQHSVHTCWCCCSHVVFSGVILIPKITSPPPTIWAPVHYKSTALHPFLPLPCS